MRFAVGTKIELLFKNVNSNSSIWIIIQIELIIRELTMELVLSSSFLALLIRSSIDLNVAQKKKQISDWIRVAKRRIRAYERTISVLVITHQHRPNSTGKNSFDYDVFSNNLIVKSPRYLPKQSERRWCIKTRLTKPNEKERWKDSVDVTYIEILTRIIQGRDESRLVGEERRRLIEIVECGHDEWKASQTSMFVRVEMKRRKSLTMKINRSGKKQQRKRERKPRVRHWMGKIYSMMIISCARD